MPAVFGGLPGVAGARHRRRRLHLDVVGFYAAGMPQVFAFVLGLSFLLLLVAFHSIVIPIKAILLNLLSTGAAYGLLVLVFQDGSAPTSSTSSPGVIEAFVPVFIFTILFGLSMDYHVFILTRIKEARDRGLGSNAAVERGISITAGTVTSAAAIMVAVFAVFVTLELTIIKQLGFGLAVAVFLDATVIRSVLLPASMRLLGDWNWWMPRFLVDPAGHDRGRDRGEGSEAVQEAEGGSAPDEQRSRPSPWASRRAHESRARERRAPGRRRIDDLPDHVRRNRAMWDEWATEYVANGEAALAPRGRARRPWGSWDIARGGPPPPARRPRRPRHDRARVRDRIRVGLAGATWRPAGRHRQLRRGQLATGARLPGQARPRLPLHHGNAEAVPCPNASFDLAISEYGASIWADPYRVDPGGGPAAPARRPPALPCQRPHPGPHRAIVTTSRPKTGCSRPYFGLHRLEWTSDNSVNFALGYGDWIPGCCGPTASRSEDLVKSRHRGGHDDLSVRDRPVGAPMAERRGLGGAQARLRSWRPTSFSRT